MNKFSGPNDFPMERLRDLVDPADVGRAIGNWVLDLFSKPHYEYNRIIKLPLYVPAKSGDRLSAYDDAFDLQGDNRLLLNSLYDYTGARVDKRSETSHPDNTGEIARYTTVIPVGQESSFVEHTFPGAIDVDRTYLPSARVLFNFSRQVPPHHDLA
jgi:hypothetical protein